MQEGAGSKTVWFDNYYQTKVTDTDFISRIANTNFTNDLVTVDEVNVVRKNGNYYYSSPVEWIVLDDDCDSYTLISKKILGKKVFDSKLRRRGWHDSEIRTWCNGTFFNLAFTESEQDNMIQSTVSNTCLSDDFSYGNITTTDYVWLLHEDDIHVKDIT